MNDAHFSNKNGRCKGGSVIFRNKESLSKKFIEKGG